MVKTKQVIVVRKDLKMRRGKEIAQGAHAAMAWLTQWLGPDSLVGRGQSGRTWHEVALTPAQRAWLEGSFRKVTCQVDSEEALMVVVRAAEAAGLECHVITDSGLTEFAGVPTITCCAIGPDDVEKIDPVTGKLSLY